MVDLEVEANVCVIILSLAQEQEKRDGKGYFKIRPSSHHELIANMTGACVLDAAESGIGMITSINTKTTEVEVLHSSVLYSALEALQGKDKRGLVQLPRTLPYIEQTPAGGLDAGSSRGQT
ncbi:hypothetical protein WJX72_010835 [[Myrmecia] bisecta]|uniref:Uncharacterized protein n=1 Tax=[Myrmecia] bisecta TaxID=41462 RepID=A0AAW1P517_9CHLO